MSDERIRDALRAGPIPEPAPGDAWAAFERRARRATLRRAAAGALALAIVATSAALAVPKLTEDDARPSPFVTEQPGKAQEYVDPIAGFRFTYPASWSARGEPGSLVEVFPREADEGPIGDLATFEVCAECGGTSLHTVDGREMEGTLIEQPKRFYVSIRATRLPSDTGCHDTDSGDTLCVDSISPSLLQWEDLGGRRAAGAKVTEGTAEWEGISSVARVSFAYPKRPVTPEGGYNDLWEGSEGKPLPPNEWCSGCRVTEYAFDFGWSFFVRVVAPDADAERTHGPIADEIIGSFGWLLIGEPQRSPG